MQFDLFKRATGSARRGTHAVYVMSIGDTIKVGRAEVTRAAERIREHERNAALYTANRHLPQLIVLITHVPPKLEWRFHKALRTFRVPGQREVFYISGRMADALHDLVNEAKAEYQFHWSEIVYRPKPLHDTLGEMRDQQFKQVA